MMCRCRFMILTNVRLRRGMLVEGQAVSVWEGRDIGNSALPDHFFYKAKIALKTTVN